MSRATIPRPVRGRRPMTELRRSRLRLEISREAVRLFRARGVAATSGEQIAAAVGLSSRTLWRYFRSKESCVEPVLSRSAEVFADALRRWPADRSLEEHLVADRHGAGPEDPDIGAALAVVAMARHEPALRAIWLLVHSRAEPVFAEVVAGRLGRSPDELAVRVQAASLCAALRITTEDLAGALADGTGPPPDAVARLSAAVHAATHGVVGHATCATHATHDPSGSTRP